MTLWHVIALAALAVGALALAASVVWLAIIHAMDEHDHEDGGPS